MRLRKYPPDLYWGSHFSPIRWRGVELDNLHQALVPELLTVPIPASNQAAALVRCKLPVGFARVWAGRVSDLRQRLRVAWR